MTSETSLDGEVSLVSSFRNENNGYSEKMNRCQ